MKKLALLTLGLATASLAHAQSGFRIGVRVGGTYSTIGGKNADQVGGPNSGADINYLAGFNAGLSFQLPLSSDGFWTLAPEILVDRKGFKRSYTISDRGTLTSQGYANNVEKFQSEGKRILTYIDLPIPVRINTAPGGSGLYFELGPQIGYMARSSQDFTQTTKFNNGDKDKTSTPAGDYKEDLASFDIGGLAGVGYQTEGGISVGVRYNQGFKSLFDTKDVSAKYEPKAFNRMFTVQLGYLLPLGK
ncbi:porin family protein [Hymenobacter sp. GOD-10R]|uniref:porin family protein n=1 Tax=Hymenobacter sp. GOD-10R TaxID=3093922 RepID=UPI002D78FEBA|nr:porin family protein [Hymenobacter sp. GOD-10R]WRQ28148.1 porin family protein [Hymenobacter sp. GOD-10R]